MVYDYCLTIQLTLIVKNSVNLCYLSAVALAKAESVSKNKIGRFESGIAEFAESKIWPQSGYLSVEKQN